MAKLRGDPKGITEPALKKSVVLTTERGQLIAKSWPRARGKPTNPVTIAQNEWLTWSARALNYAASTEWETAYRAAPGSGLYARDLLTLAAAGKLYDVVTPEGRVLTRQVDKLELKMFNGAILNLGVNAGLGAGVPLKIIWPLPVRDTFGFWDPANPTRLTIPVGVDVIELSGAVLISIAGMNRVILIVRNSAGGSVVLVDSETGGTRGSYISTGPILVNAGDWFELEVISIKAATLTAGSITFFSLNVLGSS